MFTHVKSGFWLYILTLFFCLGTFFPNNAAAQDDAEPVVTPVSTHYTFETIKVPGVDFLAVTASSDFEDYGGYIKSADGEKEIAFTLIDGVFTTYDFPGAKNTYFYALGNNGNAAGHYENSDGLFHGLVLEDGELRQYDFPGSVETEIYGISDATGALTGNFKDASGIRRGFTEDRIIGYPGAKETYADFINASGVVVGGYVDLNGIRHQYLLTEEGEFISFSNEIAADYEFFSYHGISDAGVGVARFKRSGDVVRTYVNATQLRFPGSVSTEGWNINQDGSVVGYYTTADGKTHGFIARPASHTEAEIYSNTYTVTLTKGLNMLSVPLAPVTPMNAKSLAGLAGATTVITLDTATQKFVPWTPDAPNDGFAIEGSKGYIVNVPAARNFAFVGAPWTDQMTDQTETAPAAPAITSLIKGDSGVTPLIRGDSGVTPLIRGDRGVIQETWAFVISGHLEGQPAYDGYTVVIRNLRTDATLTTTVQADYFAAATADLTRRSVIHAGDTLEVRVIGPDGNLESQIHTFKVTLEHLANAVLAVRLDDIGQPTQNLLLQNYPNPFNPETWIPYQLSEDSPVSVSIYDTTGTLVRTLSLGHQSAGFYNSRERAAYWDGHNALGERVANGVYFYQLTTPAFQQTRRLVILK